MVVTQVDAHHFYMALLLFVRDEKKKEKIVSQKC